MLKIFAEDLKAHREENNISLRDVAVKTRINISILENLENGDFTFQPQAYIRAFLKQYINAIGLDTEEVLFEYDLARSGKYKSKRLREEKPAPIIEEKEVLEEPKVTGKTLSDKLKVIVDIPVKKPEEKKITEPAAVSEKKELPLINESGASEYIESRPKNKFTINTADETSVKSRTTVPLKIKNPVSFSFLSSPLFRNVLMIAAAVLILAGLYSLINIIFLEGNKDKPEIIRQNFDDVVNEQERKILGKRTAEEIQDSIRKAAVTEASLKDSVTLKITSKAAGVVFLVIDSVNYNNPEKIEFDKDMVGVFKAKNNFFISSANTEAFSLTINDKPLKIISKSISKVKLNKDGVVKQ